VSQTSIHTPAKIGYSQPLTRWSMSSEPLFGLLTHGQTQTRSTQYQLSLSRLIKNGYKNKLKQVRLKVLNLRNVGTNIFNFGLLFLKYLSNKMHIINLFHKDYCLCNKKLSCRRETARRFLSLNTLLSHSSHSSYLTLSNIVTLKSGLEVTQDHSKWYHSKAWVRFPIRLP